MLSSFVIQTFSVKATIAIEYDVLSIFVEVIPIFIWIEIKKVSGYKKRHEGREADLL